MNFSTHVTLVDGSMKRFEIEAADKHTACMRAISQLPAMCVESVSAWPIRGDVRVCIDAPSLRMSKVAQYDSAFGCLA